VSGYSGTAWREDNQEERGGLGRSGGQLSSRHQPPAGGRGAAVLWHDRGGRRGACGSARERLADGARRQQDPVGSD
jgi:hypothetical protein